jgi:hypothetical protein
LNALKKKKKKIALSQVWWHTPAFTTLGKQRQVDCKLKVSSGYVARPCLKKNPKKIGLTISYDFLVCMMSLEFERELSKPWTYVCLTLS